MRLDRMALRFCEQFALVCATVHAALWSGWFLRMLPLRRYTTQPYSAGFRAAIPLTNVAVPYPALDGIVPHRSTT